jgi:hypothetical protein
MKQRTMFVYPGVISPDNVIATQYSKQSGSILPVNDRKTTVIFFGRRQHLVEAHKQQIDYLIIPLRLHPVLSEA